MGDGSSLLGLSQRLPPANVAAEQATLGALLANNKAYHRVAGFLEPEHFADPINGRIYQAIARRVEAGQLADAVTLKTEFEHAGILDAVGGTAYLAQILTAMVSVLNVADYGRAIHDCWVRRQLIDIGETVVNNAFATEAPGIDQIEQMEDAVVALRMSAASAGGSGRRGPVTAVDAFDAMSDAIDAMRSGAAPKPFSTGFGVLDQMIGGVAPSTLTFVIGDGGAGKTELSQQVAEHVAGQVWQQWVQKRGARDAWLADRKGHEVPEPGPCAGVLYIMLGNMTAAQMIARTAARMSGVELRHIRRAEIDMERAMRLCDTRDAIMQLPLEMVDDCPPTLAAILGEVRRFSRRRPLAMVVIDNLSDLLSAVGQEKMFGVAVSATKQLKERVARDLGCAVWLLMHTSSTAKNSLRKGEVYRPRTCPWGTQKDADAAFGVVRPFDYLDPTPPPKPAKVMSAEGDEVYSRMFADWSGKRRPWPEGIWNVTEINPIKLREQDGTDPPAVGKLVFDRKRQRFFEPSADGAEAPADPAWQEFPM